MNLNQKFQRRFLIINLILAAVVFSLHHSVGYVFNRGDYTPFSVGPSVSDSVVDETHAYAAFVQRFAKSQVITGDPDTYEMQKRRISMPTVPTAVLGWISRMVGSLEITWMLMHALLPTLLWFVLYQLLKTSLGSSLYRALATWTVLLIPFGPRSFFLMGKQSFVQPLEITRLPNPGLSFLFYCVAVILVCKAVSSAKKSQCVLAGLFSGILFHTYYFYWVAFFGGLGTLLLVAFFSRQKKLSTALLMVLTAGAVVGLPYVINGILAGGSHQPMFLRLGIHHRFIDYKGVCILLLSGAGLVFSLSRKYLSNYSFDELVHWVLLATLAGVGIGMNLQLITGFDAQHASHFMNRVFQPVAVLLAAIGLGRIIFRFQENKILVTAFATLLFSLVSLASYRQREVGIRTAYDHRVSSGRMDMLLWARNHIPSDSVIGSTDREMIMLIPAVTGNWTYVPSTYRTNAVDEEIGRRFLLVSYLQDRSFSDVDKDFNFREAIQDRSWISLSHNLFERNTQSDAFMTVMRDVWKDLKPKRELASRRLDYLALEKPYSLGRVAIHFPHHKVVYSNSDWALVSLATPVSESLAWWSN